MTYYIWLTDACRREARQHGTLQLVEHIVDQVEASQRLVGFDQFSPTRFLKRGLGRSYRLVAYRWDMTAEDSVLTFERVLPRGSGDYEYFSANYERIDPRSYLADTTDEKVRVYYARRTASEPLPPRPQMTERESSWLYGVSTERLVEEETVVLETADWVHAMKQSAALPLLGLYHQMLQSVNLQTLPQSTAAEPVQVLKQTSGNLAIAYAYWPHVKRLLLLEPLGDAQRRVFHTPWEKLLPGLVSAQEIGRLALRSYPLLMTLDREAWLAIEDDGEANLALSPEESDLLETLRGTSGGTGPRYPLFINGRAGSGKSTMLQYLVADYVEFAVTNNMAVAPLYMACSTDLLANARKNVFRFLTTHHTRLLAGGGTLEKRRAILDEILRKGFVVFHDHLYSLLNADNRSRFPSASYVDYPAFRRLWDDDYSRRQHAHRVSAELAWHVIRSYIKGSRSSPDDDLSPGEYGALPKKRRSVPVETYERVYKDVWGWYQALGRWDDQDLAAALLQQGGLRATSPVLFSDEAQDFTPLELGLILQMSIYADRALTPEDMARVPIAFAGDPLQTINPTGFRWSSVEAMFHQQFTDLLDPRRGGSLTINHQELTFNYRSQRNIVYFCNLLQLMRFVHFDADVSRPQEAWSLRDEHGLPIQWFDPDITATAEQLVTHADFVKVVNCEAGEESRMAADDALLSRLPRELDKNVYRNVLSPARAKGLEFDVVVLYKFGDTAPEGLAEVLSGQRPPPTDPQARLPYEYFLNRLYVAASRAKKRLIVVDSRRARDSFWRFATDATFGERLPTEVKNADTWAGRLAFLLDSQDDLATEQVEVLQQADEYWARGRQLRDPYLLRQASLAYQSAGEQSRGYACLGLAHEYERDYRKAGDAYAKAAKDDEAIRCYWVAREYKAILKIHTDVTLPAQRAADFMTRSATDSSGDFLEHMVQWIVEAAVPDITMDSTWQAVLGELLKRLSSVTLEPLVARRALTLCEAADRAGMALDKATFAAIAYRGGSNNRAVTLWEEIGQTEHQDYRRARARIEPFPGNLEWLARARDHERVVEEWRSHAPSAGSVADDIVRMVIDSAIHRNEVQLAIDLLTEAPRVASAATAFAKSVSLGDMTLAAKGAIVLARAYVREHDWEAAIAAGEANFPKVIGQELLARIARASRESLLAAVGNELARSQDLSADPKGNQPVADFLVRNFIGRRATTRALLPVAVIGAAFERAGRFINALQYYETVYDDHSYSQEDRLLAALRMIRINERLADHSRRTGDSKYADDRMRRAAAMRDTVRAEGVALADLPEFPLLERGHAVTLASLGSQWTDAGYAVTRIPEKRRLRIESVARRELVTLDLANRELLGETPVSVSSTSDAETVWAIPAWGCTVSLRTGATSSTVELAGSTGSVSIEL
jgi:hypothetical protein